MEDSPQLEEQFLVDNISQYLGIRHDYNNINCISLVKQFYKQELGLDFELPEFTRSRFWVRDFTTEYVEKLILQYAIKIQLTDIKNYDLIAFKSKTNSLINHFGMYVAPGRILHLQDGDLSRLDYLTQEQIDSIYGIYRHKSLV